MERSARVQHALPPAVLAAVVGADVAAGPDQVILGLVVLAPVTAAAVLGRRATLAHALLALLAAALTGAYDQQYAPEALPTQLVRLAGIAVGGGLAVAACTLRVRREAELARLSASAATSAAIVRMAETLQRDLLGPPPDAGPWQATVRYVPASRHAQVGGDWYDSLPAPDGSTVLVIGDVAGHGPPAAATMAQARGMVRAAAQSVAGSPAGMLAVVDRVAATVGLATLVTAVVAVLVPHPAAGRDGPAATLRWSNAGHPPPVLLRTDGTARLLDRQPAPLLGVAADAVRVDHELPLQPGDTLLLYTDGLVERRAALIDEGFSWLVDTVRRYAQRPLDELCDGLLAAIGGRVEDDVALLAVRVPDS